MIELLNNLFDIQDILSRGLDVTVYFFMGVVGFVLLVIRLALTLLLGDFDTDMDVDLDVGDGGDISHGGDFSVFSVLSILAFFTAIGWTGVLCRIDIGLGPVPSAVISTLVGIVFMLFAAGMMFYIRKLNSPVSYKIKDAVGRTATVYLSIPRRGEGAGQVTVTVSGRSMTRNAISTGEAIPAFTEVVVTDARDDETLIVEPRYPAEAAEAATQPSQG